MVDFLDFIVEKKENSTTYPFYEKIKVDLKTFLSALPTSVYPQFSRHPKEAQYTWTLLWEQRVFWVCHFALNMVAEMCAQISQFTEEEEEEVKEEDKPQKIQELKVFFCFVFCFLFFVFCFLFFVFCFLFFVFLFFVFSLPTFSHLILAIRTLETNFFTKRSTSLL